MPLFPFSSIRTAGHSIFRAAVLPLPSSMRSVRPYSAAAAPTIAEIEKRIFDVLRAFDKVNEDKLKPTARFAADLGLDSLDVVEVVMAIEEEFATEIPDAAADSFETPNDAVKYINERLNPGENAEH